MKCFSVDQIIIQIFLCVSKIALFDKALVLALARGALAMCAMWVGFHDGNLLVELPAQIRWNLRKLQF